MYNRNMNMSFSLPVSILKEGSRYVAYTPALDLSTSGNDESQVKIRFGEAIQLFFEELIKEGTLEEVLLELGWQRVDEEWKPPEVISQDKNYTCSLEKF